MFEFFRLRKRSQTPENSHLNLMARINKIQTDNGMRVFSHWIGNKSIRTSHSSIQELNRFLVKTIFISQTPSDISPQMFGATPVVMGLKDWFIDRNGYYLDPINELAQFKEKTKELIEIYMDLELTPNETNIRACSILTPQINQISEITDQLIIVTKPVVQNQPLSGIKDSGY